MDEIAADCGITTRPIFHYFGNKLTLFSSVIDVMNERVMANLSGTTDLTKEEQLARWHGFLDLCDDPGFRRILLIDAPSILGRESWNNQPVITRALDLVASKASDSKADRFCQALQSRMIIAALAEAALVVAEADDIQLAKRESARLVWQLVGQLTA